MKNTIFKITLVTIFCLALAGCGNSGFWNRANDNLTPEQKANQNSAEDTQLEARGLGGARAVSIFDALRAPDQNTNLRVNKYLWNASLETLNFLPVESADPFTGILVMGWGRAPGSGRQYRATILIQDPALDARSLKISIQTRGGVASAETVRRIEDAILTRARQLRVRDKNL
ncbi:MAG: DUF3576 domain-containing protein [Amylibacter sp.]